jgi:hypothetical protein
MMKALVSLLTLSIILSPIPAIAAESIYVTFATDGVQNGETESSITKIDQIGSSNGLPYLSGDQLCDSLQDPDCQNAKVGILADLILPKCETSENVDCVESLKVKFKDTELLNTEFFGYTKGEEVIIKNGDQSLSGKSSSIYSVKYGNDIDRYFLVTTKLSALLAKRADLTYGKIQIPYFGIDITEVELSSGNDCLAIYQDECISKAASSSAFIEATLRLSTSPPNWLAGRMSGPSVEVSEILQGKRVKLSGESVEVPKIYGDVSPSAFYNYPAGYPNSYISRLSSENGYLDIQPGLALMYAKDIFKELKEKSDEIESRWSLNGSSRFTAFCSENLQVDCLQGGNGPCIDSAENFGGVLATNAMTFSRNPPQIIDGEIQYLLASPHFLPDGKTTSGSFDLEISAKALRCIYSLPNLPLAAEISVVTSEGRPKIATTLFTEKNGVTKIIVKNFSYSTPKIKIKFTQAQKKISITCTKGKLKKVISGSKPTCPKGYKKTA